jgi:hypothetical protein
MVRITPLFKTNIAHILQYHIADIVHYDIAHIARQIADTVHHRIKLNTRHKQAQILVVDHGHIFQSSIMARAGHLWTTSVMV